MLPFFFALKEALMAITSATLTKDTVPVEIDATAFWHIWDGQKALLEVESYYRSIALAVQTALRDIIGIHSLAEILAEREKMGETLGSGFLLQDSQLEQHHTPSGGVQEFLYCRFMRVA